MTNDTRVRVAYNVFNTLRMCEGTIEVMFDCRHPDVYPEFGRYVQSTRYPTIDLGRTGDAYSADEDGIDAKLETGDIYIPWGAVEAIITRGYTVRLTPDMMDIIDPTYLLSHPLRGVPGGTA